MVMLVSLLSLAWVQSGTVAEALAACAEIDDNAARLACFDEATKAPKPEKPPAPAASSPQPANEDQAAYQRTLEEELAETRARAEKAEATVRGYQDAVADVETITLSPLGVATIRLHNGEVWQQLDSDSTRLSPGQIARVESAEIQNGAIGSRWIKLQPIRKRLRVTRIEPSTPR